MIFDRPVNLKNKTVLDGGYYVSAVGLTEAAIKKCARKQELWIKKWTEYI